MSRVGKQPVLIVPNVKVSLQKQTFQVTGPKGTLSMEVHPRMKVTVQEKEVQVARPTNLRTDRALHGLTRSLIQNMVTGVTEGYTKELEIIGIGVRAQVKDKVLSMQLGYTHPVEYPITEGIEIKCPKPTQIVISGMDKQRVGQTAAEIRSFYKPEPYKGKGIRYVGEQVRRKQGKAVG